MAVYLLPVGCLVASCLESQPLSFECVSCCFRNIVYVSSSHIESGGKQERKGKEKTKGEWGSFTGADGDIVISSR